MTPSAPAVLSELAALLVRCAQPGAPEPERAGALGLSAMLLTIAAEVWDRSAAVLVEENRAFRALLGEVDEDRDLRVSALQAENNRLRARLIAAHAEAEDRADAAREAAIWSELARSTERRKLSTSPV
jgi:multidrug efflux pump subunit AcrA (membrane-fusion protein)